MGTFYIPRFYVPAIVAVQDDKPLTDDEENDFLDDVDAAYEDGDISLTTARQIIDRQYGLMHPVE